jgi:hypothetical protein
MMHVTILDRLPEGILGLEAGELHRLLPGPTLIHLPGRRPEVLFVSVLLHGNEDTGWLAVREVLRKFESQPLSRSMSLFIGNVAAAREGARRLEGQHDYNRIWPGTESPDCPECEMAAEVVEEMRRWPLFASLDIHNNTGLNPHYACVNRLEAEFLQLATLFSRTVVYFTRPVGVQSAAFAQLCPAVTLECGKPGMANGTAHAAGFVEACLHLSEFPRHPVPAYDIDLYHTVATVKVPADLSFSFDGEDGHIRFEAELDHFNFRELPAETLWGWVSGRLGKYLEVTDEAGRDVSQAFFDCGRGQLRLRKRLMPAMLTKDSTVIRQDCLCYLMERLPYPG